MKKLLLLGLFVLVITSITGCGLFTEKCVVTHEEVECEIKPIFEVEYEFVD